MEITCSYTQPCTVSNQAFQFFQKMMEQRLQDKRKHHIVYDIKNNTMLYQIHPFTADEIEFEAQYEIPYPDIQTLLQEMARLDEAGMSYVQMGEEQIDEPFLRERSYLQCPNCNDEKILIDAPTVLCEECGEELDVERFQRLIKKEYHLSPPFVSIVHEAIKTQAQQALNKRQNIHKQQEVQQQEKRKQREQWKEIKKALIETSLQNTEATSEIGLKLSEEAGEVTRSILSALNVSDEQYEEQSKEEIQEGAVDVMMVALSLFMKVGGTEDRFLTILKKKIKK